MDPDGAAASGLTDELMRRLSLREAATAQSAQQHATSPTSPSFDHRDVSRHPRLFCEERHDAGDDGSDQARAENSLVLKWRQKEKLKTTAVALVLCLNIGVDPPDVIKISPCARLECWVDPNSLQPAKALEAIGKNLQAQYERWQPKAKYKMHLDPTVEDVKKLAQSSRRNAKTERVLFHYNGHGVPRPTANGELWVFNARYTQYIPMSVYELQSWLGTPAIYVLDCSSAGIVINSFKALMDHRSSDLRSMGQGPAYPGIGVPAGGASDPMKEIIVLAACGANEVLPQTPELPADVFTACLTTPIKVALRWFASRSLLRHDGITKELIDKIPGRQTDRKTPLGELNWIFTAITDTIAWNVLPRALFQKLFRSDLLVASLFRNFLLAERIMTAVGCTPMSLPRLPPTHQHPMWQAWDMAAEMCLMQLPTLLSDTAAEFQPSPFFSEQLTAFELWLTAGSRDRAPPEQLPIVLQVLLSQVHRLRALVLLGRFLDMGSWAVDLALSVGIFPYVLKLLQTTSQDLRATLVFIWAKILALDKSCQVDLIKDSGHIYFIRYLDSQDSSVEPTSRAQAAFVLSVICDGHVKGQTLCANNGLLTVLLRWLRTYFPPQTTYPSHGHALLLKWLCLCLGKLCQDSPEISLMAIREGAADQLVALIGVAPPEIRAAALFGLGCLVHAPGPGTNAEAAAPGHAVPAVHPLEDRLPAEQLIANAIRQVVYDPSVLVRCELAVLYARYVRGHAAQVQDALALQQRKLHEFARQHRPHAPTPAADAAGAGIASQESGEGRSGGQSWRAADEQQVGLPRAGRAASEQTSNPASSSSSTMGSSIDRPASAPLPGVMPGSHTPGGGMGGQSRGMSNVYTAMVESMQLLALDPSPKVAALGRQVLKVAQCELNILGLMGPLQSTGPHSPHPPAAAGGAAGNSSASSSALGSFTQKLRRPGWGSTRPFTPSATIPPTQVGPQQLSSGPGAVPGALQGAESQGMDVQYSIPSTPSHGSTAGSPAKDFGFSRPPYVLYCKHDQDTWGRSSTAYGSHMGHVHSAVGSPASVSSQSVITGSGPSGSASRQHLQPASQALDVGGAQGGLGGVSAIAAVAQEPLPASKVYHMSCEAFARPLLEPGTGSVRDGAGSSHPPAWTAPVDKARRAGRLDAIISGISRSRQLTQPKLREQVYSVDSQGDGLARVCFHPYHNLLVCADTLGVVRVLQYDAPPATRPVQTFHAANGAAPGDPRAMPTTITHLQHITEADGPMLLVGAADGAVRVWRHHTFPNQSATMATAMQAVTIQLPPAQGRSTCYAWAGARCQLFAAGGAHPEMVYCWDMSHEMCCNMLSMSLLGSSASVPCVDGIHLGVADPNLLLAACSDATLRLFDVRAPRGPALVMAPFKSQLAGVGLEPAGRQGMIVAASEKGELVLLDTRAALGSTASALAVGAPPPGLAEVSAAATTKTVAAHSKGGVCCLVSHSVAPLLATGTTNQVVKVWTDQCDAVGAIRAHSTTHSPNKLGSVSCMTWHAYQPLLVAGGSDGIATVYTIDQAAKSSNGML